MLVPVNPVVPVMTLVPVMAGCNMVLHRVLEEIGNDRVLVRGFQQLTTGESGRGARRGGRAESGRIGCQQNCSFRKQGCRVPSKASKKRRLNVSPETRKSEILCKPSAGTKSSVDSRFILGLFAVYKRDRERSLFLAADQWIGTFLSL